MNESGWYNGYPIREAAKIAVFTTKASIAAGSSIEEVIFCCFSSEDLEVYESILQFLPAKIS